MATITVRMLLVPVLCLAFALAAGEAAAYQITYAPQPNPPDAGEGKLAITVKDDAGKPVEGAQVAAVFSMPAMGTMPAMEAKATTVAKGGGTYVATFDLPMGGTWELAVTIDEGGKKTVARGSITTGIPDVSVKDEGRAAAAGGEAPVLDVGPRRLQTIGVRFAEAQSIAMRREVRAIGVVEQDKTHREEVTPRYSGYIAKQFKGRVGDQVKKGEPLFSVYSPELVTAQSEFLLAEKVAEGGHSLHKAAADRLRNLGLSDGDIAAIRASGAPKRDLTIRAPISGTILEVNGREGGAITAGQPIYVVGDLSKSYIVARVFQQDVIDLKAGQAAEVTLPHQGSRARGRIDLVYPSVESGAGTANVRVEVEGYVQGLQPGVYVEARFPVELGQRLVIPAESVLYSGMHNYVFVDKGGGSLEPREIVTGRRAGDLVEVVEGLAAGERVAASGTFLLGSEAQLRSALPKWKAAGGEPR